MKDSVNGSIVTWPTINSEEGSTFVFVCFRMLTAGSADLLVLLWRKEAEGQRVTSVRYKMTYKDEK